MCHLGYANYANDPNSATCQLCKQEKSVYTTLIMQSSDRWFKPHLSALFKQHLSFSIFVVKMPMQWYPSFCIILARGISSCPIDYSYFASDHFPMRCPRRGAHRTHTTITFMQTRSTVFKGARSSDIKKTPYNTRRQLFEYELFATLSNICRNEITYNLENFLKYDITIGHIYSIKALKHVPARRFKYSFSNRVIKRRNLLWSVLGHWSLLERHSLLSPRTSSAEIISQSAWESIIYSISLQP